MKYMCSIISVVVNSGVSAVLVSTFNPPTVILVEILECCVKVLLSIQFVHVYCCGDELVIVN